MLSEPSNDTNFLKLPICSKIDGHVWVAYFSHHDWDAVLRRATVILISLKIANSYVQYIHISDAVLKRATVILISLKIANSYIVYICDALAKILGEYGYAEPNVVFNT